MFQRKPIPPNAKVELRLAPRHRDLLVQRTWLPPALLDRLRLGSREGKELSFTFTLSELAQLADHVAGEAERAEDRETGDQLDEIYGRAIWVLDNHREEGEPEEDDEEVEYPELDLDEMPEMLREGLLNVLRDSTIETVEELENRLLDVAKEYVSREDPELGGLSPQQIVELLRAEWTSGDSPVLLNHVFELSELQQAPIFLNARILLAAIAQQNGVKATNSGNLNRRFIGEILDSLIMPPGELRMLREECKVVNEQDVWILHTVRVLLESSQLVQQVGNRFIATDAGENTLADAEAGVLYCLLFHAMFNEVNLAYFDPFDEVPEVQECFPYSLYVLSKDASDWQEVSQLAPRLLLPYVRRAISAASDYWEELDYVDVRVLHRLEDFGLIESRLRNEAGEETVYVRKTPLFDRFLSFRLEGSES